MSDEFIKNMLETYISKDNCTVLSYIFFEKNEYDCTFVVEVKNNDNQDVYYSEYYINYNDCGFRIVEQK
jgi:hypothetical protein